MLIDLLNLFLCLRLTRLMQRNKYCPLGHFTDTPKSGIKYLAGEGGGGGGGGVRSLCADSVQKRAPSSSIFLDRLEQQRKNNNNNSCPP